MLRFQSGDRDGFRILFTKYSKKIINFCYRFCGDRAMAEELAQEVFLRVYKAAPRYRPEAKFSTWLFRIATNVCLNEMRKYQYRVVTENMDTPFQTDSGSVKPEMADPDIYHPQDLMEKKDDDRILKHALKSLPKKQRTALLLKVYNNFSYQEIGQQMKHSESAVKSLIHRARQTLIKIINNTGRSI
ncbi:MAG: RNA polymerase sigma factor [Pseudomonadota bacterium]